MALLAAFYHLDSAAWLMLRVEHKTEMYGGQFLLF
jgi:hypothetical protein